MLSKACRAWEKGCDFIAPSMFCKCPEQILLDVYILRMFTGTGPGRCSVGALPARPDLSAKREMTAANTLPLWQVVLLLLMTRDMPQYFSVKWAFGQAAAKNLLGSGVILLSSEALDYDWQHSLQEKQPAYR